MKHKSVSSWCTSPPAVSGRSISTRASSFVPDTSHQSLTSSRMSARLARVSKSQDIYPHSATKNALDSAEHEGTRNSDPAGLTLKRKRAALRPIDLKRKRGRRTSRPNDLADEGTKAALMEQWANLRMSQGTLLSSKTVGRHSDTTPHLSSSHRNHEPPLGGRPEVEILSCGVVEPDKLPDITATSDRIEPTCLFPSISPALVAEPRPEVTVTNESIFTPPLGFVTKNIPSERFSLSECELQCPSSPLVISQPAVEDISLDLGMVEAIAQAPHPAINSSLEVANQPLQLLATDSELVSLSLRPPIARIISKLDTPPESAILEGPAPLVEPEDHKTGASPSAVDIQLLVSTEADVDYAVGFHMLDLHEVLSPWVPMSPTAPSIYVPPAVHHLISGTRSSYSTLTELTVCFFLNQA